jgi:hypothetical protein
MATNGTRFSCALAALALAVGCGGGPSAMVAASPARAPAASATGESAPQPAAVDPMLVEIRERAAKLIARCAWDETTGFSRSCDRYSEWRALQLDRPGIWLTLLESDLDKDRFLAFVKLDRGFKGRVGLEPLLAAAEREKSAVLRGRILSLIEEADVEIPLVARMAALILDPARPVTARRRLLEALAKRARSRPELASALQPTLDRVLSEGPKELRAAATITASCQRAKALLSDPDDAVFVEAASILITDALMDRPDASTCEEGASTVAEQAKRRGLEAMKPLVGTVAAMPLACGMRGRGSRATVSLGKWLAAGLEAEARANPSNYRAAISEAKASALRDAVSACSERAGENQAGR